MKNLVFSELTELKLTDQAVLEYLGTLFLIGTYCPANGEQILSQGPGYNSKTWVESLFKVAADCGCFRRPRMSIERALPFVAVRPLITPGLTAEFCLSDDILQAIYYEHLCFTYYRHINRSSNIAHRLKRVLPDLHDARHEFCHQKQQYLRVAHRGKVPRRIYKFFDMDFDDNHPGLKAEFLPTFAIMSSVMRLCPRPVTSDLIPLSDLCRKNAQLLALCDEALASLSG